MANQQVIHCNSIMDNCRIVGKNKIQCEVCIRVNNEPFIVNNDKILVEHHLFHQHNIITNGKFIWGDEFSTVNQNFKPVNNKYLAQCNECKSVLKPKSKFDLHRHLILKHETILNTIKDEIENNSCVSGHFNLTPGRTMARCRYCNFSCKTVNGVNFLKRHLNRHPQKISECDTGTRSYNVDAAIQQLVAEENYASTSHSVRQSDTMAQQVTYSDSILKHIKFSEGRWHCNLCTTKSTEKIIMEAHLFHIHKISIKQSDFIWDDNIIKRYFTGTLPNSKYFVKCTICKYPCSANSKDDLYNHLTKHETVLKEIRGEIRNSWAENHFEMSSCYTQACCKHCQFSCGTFRGIDHLKTHLISSHQNKINEHLESGRQTRSYNVDATIQQTVAEENYASTSHSVRQSDTMAQQVTYCDSIMEHVNYIKGLWYCTLCSHRTQFKNKMTMEAHLFHVHKKYTRDSDFIWNDNIIKRYFTTTFPNDKYFVRCTRCDYSHRANSKNDLYNHLTKHETVLEEIRGEIKNSWVKDYFEISSCYTQARCTHCTKFSSKTVRGIDYLKTHLISSHKNKINKHLKSGRQTRSCNVDATIQQPVAEEIYASGSFHHDNRQTFGNREDQQRPAPGTSTSININRLFILPPSPSDETRQQTIQPEQGPEGTAGHNIEPIPGTSTSMSDENLIMFPLSQHRPYDETRQQTIQPEQGTAGLNIELEDEDEEMLNLDESNVLDLPNLDESDQSNVMELLQWFEQ